MSDDPFTKMSPDEVAAMTERLAFTDEPVEPPIETGSDAEPVLFPTSVKLSRALQEASKQRAKDLGMSQSAWIRSLIERDLAEASTSEQRPEWARQLMAVIAEYGTGDRKAS